MRGTRSLVLPLVAMLAIWAAVPAGAKPPADKDKEAPGSFSFVGTPYTVAEGAGTLTVTVQRSMSVDGATGKGKTAVTIATSDGTATAGSDYTAVATTLEFASGQTEASVNIAITDDTAVESSETFALTLSEAKGRYDLPDPPTTTVTITDNDAPVGPLLVNGGFETGTFGGQGVDWWIRRPLGGVEPQPVVETKALGGSAPHGGDYLAQMGGTFGGPADSQIQQVVSVPATGTTTVTWWWQMSCVAYAGVGDGYALLYPVPESGAPTVLWHRCDSWWSTWTQETVDLTAWKGQTIKLVFGVSGQYRSNSIWIDDVAVTNVPTP